MNITSKAQRAGNEFVKGYSKWGDVQILNIESMSEEDTLQAVRFDAFMQGVWWTIEEVKKLDLTDDGEN